MPVPGYGRWVMRRRMTKKVGDAAAFGCGNFLTTHLLGHEGWGLALGLDSVSGLGYGLLLNLVETS
jgi:hypothetical protein